VVVDVSNSPSFEDAAVLKFFQTSTGNLLAAEGGGRASSRRAVDRRRRPPAAERLLRAKVAQENLIKSGGVPYSILRSTQFSEFMGRIADSATEGNIVRLPTAYVQPIVSDDVVGALADVVMGAPINGMVEVAGPEKFRLDDLVRRVLRTRSDARQVTGDIHARYFGTELRR
jgi:uncharacterized protein YbjT (DUF2867 family)